MNEKIKAGQVFKLGNVAEYEEGKIVSEAILENEKMKLVVMAFDRGMELSTHAAPGDALVFALEGEAVITYEGADHQVEAGENFHFAKGALHSVKAEGRFKMALLIAL